MKRLYLHTLIIFASLSFADEMKRAFLPGYTPETTVTSEVERFVEEHLGDSEKIHVSITRMDLPEESLGLGETKIEYFSKNGKKNFFINDEAVSERQFFNYERTRNGGSFDPLGYDAFMTASEIKKIIEAKQFVHVELFKERYDANAYIPNFRNYTDLLNASKISTNAFVNGYMGDGIGVYFTETGCPNLTDLNLNYYSQADSCPNGMRGHPTGVARVIQTTAPHAKVFGFDQINYPNPNEFDPILRVGSHSWGLGDDANYNSEDMKMDNYIYRYGVANFVAAGNKVRNDQTFQVTTPGKAVNAITVGAVDPGTHKFADYSRWINSNVGNQKPEVANYTNFLFPGDSTFDIDRTNYYHGNFSGTSAATPYTAGFAADVMQRHPSLQGHPEVMKAYLLSIYGRSVYSPNGFDQDNNTTAASMIPWYNPEPDNAHFLNWYGDNSCCFEDNVIEFTESNIIAGKTYRIAIAWLTPGCYVFQHGFLSQDIDLFVYQGDTFIESSVSGRDPFEIVEFTAQNSQNLRILIHRFSNSGVGKVALGYSISHN